MGRALTMRRALASVAALVAVAPWPSLAQADSSAGIDIGARAGYAFPVGSFDRGTHALDTSFGGFPIGLDAAVRLGPPRRWGVEIGAFASLAPTAPTLCATAASCVGSVGRDFEVDLLARFRGPRLAFVLPEAEIASGWSWSSRSLEDGDARSTRRWSGPVLLRAALVPTFPLGGMTRLGVVLGGSVAGTASSRLVAPGVDQSGLRGGVHGTLDVGVRIAFDLAVPPGGAMERGVLAK